MRLGVCLRCLDLWSTIAGQRRVLCDVLLGMYLLLAPVYAHCGGDWMGFRGNSHVGPVFRWHVVLESLLTI